MDNKILHGEYKGYSVIYIPTGCVAPKRVLYETAIVIQNGIVQKDRSGDFKQDAGDPMSRMVVRELICLVKSQQKEEKDLTGAIVTPIRSPLTHTDTFEMINADDRYEIMHQNHRGVSLKHVESGRLINGKWNIDNLFIITQPSVLRDISRKINKEDIKKDRNKILLLL